MAAPTYWVRLGAAANPMDASPTVSDITPHVRSMSWGRGRSSILDDIGPGGGSVRLKNPIRWFEPGFGASPYNPLRCMRPVNIGCNWLGTDYSLFYGFAEAWNVEWSPRYGQAYAETELRLVDAIAVFANNLYTGNFGSTENAVVRIGTILNQATCIFPAAMRDLSGGVATNSFGLMGGLGNVWAALQFIVQANSTSDQPLFIDRRGYVVYKPMVVSTSTVFGDSGGELPYTALSQSYDMDQVYNYVTVTALGGTPQTVQDATSILRYRHRMYTGAGGISDATALARANLILTNYKEPRPVMQGFQVKPAYNSALWTASIPLDLEHQITIKRRPPGGGVVIVAQPKIVGLSWSVPEPHPASTVISYDLAELLALPPAGRV